MSKSGVVIFWLSTHLFRLFQNSLNDLWRVKRDLEDFYDVAASIIVVALWIFYASLVFLFGASFTKAYSKSRGKALEPESYAYKFKEVRDDG